MGNTTEQNKTKQNKINRENKKKKKEKTTRWSNQETENGLRERAFNNNKYAGIISSWQHIEANNNRIRFNSFTTKLYFFFV